MKTTYLLLVFLSVHAVAQTNVYVRVNEGTKPYKYELLNESGVVIETRNSSVKDEELFSVNSYGYGYKVTDATGKSYMKMIDAVSHRVMNKPVRLRATYYGDVSEQVRAFNAMSSFPGFNMYSGHFHAFQYLGTQAQWDHPRWTQAYDHTAPDQTEFDDVNTIDRLIYTAYHSGSSIETRRLLRITFDGGCLDSQISSAGFTYGTDDLMRTVNQEVFDARPSNGYLTRIASYASDRALMHYKEALRKFCTRYQKAINDGTIAGISFFNTDNGEANYPAHVTLADGSPMQSFGDYCLPMRTKFVQWCQEKFGTIQTFNSRTGANVSGFSVNEFTPELLKDGPADLQKHYVFFHHWIQAQFEYQAQKYVFEKVPLTRKKFYWLDIAALMNGDAYRMRAYLYNLRLSLGDWWAAVKSNNSNDYGEDEWVVDQINSAARFAGAAAVWEPSPPIQYFTPPGTLLVNAVNAITNSGIGLSGFYPPNERTLWIDVANATGLASKSYTRKSDDLLNGNVVNCKVMFKSIALEGKGDELGAISLSRAWSAARNANPGKRVAIIVDYSDILADFNP